MTFRQILKRDILINVTFYLAFALWMIAMCTPRMYGG